MKPVQADAVHRPSENQCFQTASICYPPCFPLQSVSDKNHSGTTVPPLEYCRQKAAESKSSFLAGFRFLPQPKRDAMTVLYAFCRELDDVVDDCSDRHVAQTTLNWWRGELAKVFGGETPEHPVCRALKTVAADFGLPQEELEDIINGMQMDLEQARYGRFEDLKLYCYRVAGVVGRLIAHILGFRRPETLQYAETLGLALPAQILKDITGISYEVWLAAIIIYYLCATVLPIDTIIGKIYPVFGLSLLIMALGIGGGLILNNANIPEIAFVNMNPSGRSVFPYLCITIACGAISGFHATQSPMMARCLRTEKDGRKVFYGAMISEGIIALIWAAAAMSFFGGIPQLAEAGPAAVVVNKISVGILGKVGGALALLGVVACPITSGDTAFRSARLTIADSLKYKQGPIVNRFVVAIPLFVLGIALCFIPFNVVWRYFGWSNQTLATIALWAAVKYLANRGKNYWIALIPAMFMTVVVTSYILAAPEGFVRFFGDKDIKVIENIAIIIGCVVSLGCTAAFFMSNKKSSLITE